MRDYSVRSSPSGLSLPLALAPSTYLFSSTTVSALSTKLITVQRALSWLVCLFFQPSRLLFFFSRRASVPCPPRAFPYLYSFSPSILNSFLSILPTASAARATFCRMACLTVGHGRSRLPREHRSVLVLLVFSGVVGRVLDNRLRILPTVLLLLYSDSYEKPFCLPPAWTPPESVYAAIDRPNAPFTISTVDDFTRFLAASIVRMHRIQDAPDKICERFAAIDAVARCPLA